MKKLPEPRTGAYRLLAQLAKRPGTFYQVCERAGAEIESDRAEKIQRQLFATLITSGHARLVGITYFITPAAMAAICPPAPYKGQVAGAAYRRMSCVAAVTIVRRAEGART